MNTAVKTKNETTTNNAKSSEQPRRLSKFGQWRRENPEGILIVKDWRAVNK
jgi:hypothetical protein